MKSLLGEYQNEMTHKRAHFCSKSKQWYNFWRKRLNKVNEQIQAASKTGKRVDDRSGFTLGDPQDGIIEALNFADTDVFPNIRKLLILPLQSNQPKLKDVHQE